MNNSLKIILLFFLSTITVFSQEKTIYIEFPTLFYKKGVAFSDSNRVSIRISGFVISDISVECIKEAEKILLNEVKKSKKEKTILTSPSRKMYKFSNRQYVGYKNEKGEKIIMMRLFYFKKKKYRKSFDFWDKAVITGYGGVFEKYEKRYFINIDEKKFVGKNLKISAVLIPYFKIIQN